MFLQRFKFWPSGQARWQQINLCLSSISSRLQGLRGGVNHSAAGPGPRAGASPETVVEAVQAVCAEQRRVGEAARTLQEKFLQLGSRLESLNVLAGRLLARGELLMALALGHGEGQSVLGSAASMALSEIEFVAGCEKKTNQLIEALQDARSRLSALLSTGDGLEQCTAPLKYIQVLVKVESARLPSEVRASFLALTAEIEQLATQAQKTVRERFQQIQPAGRILLALEENLRRQAAAYEGTLRDWRHRVQGTLAGLQSGLAQNQNRQARLPVISQAISRDMGRVVLNLQVQDIINQKLQHVMEAVDRINAGLAGPKSPSGMWRQTSRLQAAQIESAQSDLQEAARNIALAVRGVIDMAARFDANCLSLCDVPADSLALGKTGSAEVLLQTFRSLRESISALVRDVQRDYDTAAPIEGMAANLSSTVGQMASGMHLIAINAQVQAAQTGDGTGLSVLADSLARLSGEIGGFSKKVVTGLDGMGHVLSDLARTLEEWRSQGQQHQTAMEQTGREHEAALAAYQENAAQCTRDLTAIARQIMEEAQYTIDEAEALPGVLSPATDLSQALETLAESLPELPEADASLAMENLAGNYTMASELAVHQRFMHASKTRTAAKSGSVNGPANSATPAAAATIDGGTRHEQKSMHAVPEGSNDLGDNVELF